ncbi:MAG: hypothetical protein ACYDDI_09510 [Candidatus Acidiferrales bacterium]
MAIVACKLNPLTTRPDKIWRKMRGVIEFYCSRIFEIRAQRRELRVPREREYAVNKMRRADACGQVCVTLRAGRVAHGGKPSAPLMLDMARRARGSKNLIRVMNRPVVAYEASLIRYRMAKGDGIRNMARGAFLPEKSVRGRDRTHAVGRAVF